MFKNLKYKRKVLYLSIGFIVFLFIAYSLTIKKTINAKRICDRMEVKKESLKNAPLKIKQIKQELAVINNKIGKDITENMDIQSAILDKTGKYCQKNGLILKSFPKTHYHKEKDYMIITNIIVMEGDFVKMLKLIYQFEQKFKLGKVISVKFNKEKDRISKRLKLYGTLYIQNIKSINNET